MTDDTRATAAIRDQLREAVTHLRSCSPLAAERLDALLSDLDELGYFAPGFVAASLGEWAALKLSREVAQSGQSVGQLLLIGIAVSELGRVHEGVA